jgi:FAD:protein FMN transferase
MRGPVSKNVLTRRRFIAVTAMAAAGVMTAAHGAPPAPVTWRGRAMGAETSITLYPADLRQGRELLAHCRNTIGRLESELSLYQPDSALCRLNHEGALEGAPDALLQVLGIAREIHDLTGGAFDVSVQPLWRLYADHFLKSDANPEGPAAADISAARARVDANAIEIRGRTIRLKRPHMSLTLNGIAQGYITDQVAGLLRDAGMRHVLLDLGEFRALGPHPDGRPWRIGLRDPGVAWRLMDAVPLSQGAIATSGGYGTVFDAAGRFHHLFDPETGGPARHYLSLSIQGPDAARADALSTGLSALPPERAGAVLHALGVQWGGWFVLQDGEVRRHNWPPVQGTSL